MQRMTLGDFELTAVSDGIYHLDGGGMFGVVPKALWERKVKPDGNNLVPLGLNSVVVRTGSQTVLIETGVGNKLSERMVKIYGQPAELLEKLSARRASRRKTSTSSSTAICTSIIAAGTPSARATRLPPLFPRRNITCRKANGNTRTKISATGSATSPRITIRWSKAGR